ncbi:ABC transporter permease [Mesorhizobium sp. B3-1-6]|uniref:ABC transporter permease n=1 Tax=Mesorhizobium sp. B3-1-6 TaxID=2589895 RepID=UPI00112BEE7F|nr:ABC transporter permease [Mesorhizobium sp. B3-1-6]TPI41324.1 ABC transporter permease [Mesorhizobium sp. B3-1-6]
MVSVVTSNFTYYTRKNRNVLLAVILYIVVFLLVNGTTSDAFSYFNLKTTIGGGGTLALAAMGQTLVILTGGFDLSAGAVISLVNVIVGNLMTDSISNQALVGLLGIAVGGAVGLFNGLFIAYLRMQPIVVTLATLFIVQGLALLVSPTPGGYVAGPFMDFLGGNAIENVLPAAFVVIACAVVLWLFIKNSRFGTAIYAIGSDEAAALAAGIGVRRVKLMTYTLAGFFYGMAGIFLSAQSGGSDPLVGDPMLLPIFAAVVLGGTSLGGGRGGLVGSVIGAYLLMMFINILLIFNLPAYLAPIADGLVLILAVLVGMIGARDSFLHNIADVARRLRGALWSGRRPRGNPVTLPIHRRKTGAIPSIRWIDRNWENLRLALPAYITFVVVVLVTWLYIGNLSYSYLRSLLILSTFLGILAFGQTAVVLSGGLDLSIPWMIPLAGALFASIASDGSSLAWIIPLVLACGIVTGAVNGIGVAVLGLPPIVMTLASNGILQGLTLFYTQGSSTGMAPPAMLWLTNGTVLGLAPLIWLMFVFVAIAVAVLKWTYLGRNIYAVGNNANVANLSGIDVRSTLITVYAISGFCAALVGILLVGFNGAANLDMGGNYLLPSIAVVVAGGVLITGGRGTYLGVIGGVLLLIALQVLITGTMLPDAVRSIIFGFVLLGALMALQQRRTV